MNYSERINKLIESDKIYEQLIDDPTVSVLFGLCQVNVLKDILKEQEKFLEDLKKGILHEIPDYNVDDIKNFLNRQRTSKIRRDAEILSNNNEKIIDILNKDYKDIMNVTIQDLASDIDDNKSAKVKLLLNIIFAIEKKDPNIFENCFRPFMKKTESIEESQVL